MATKLRRTMRVLMCWAVLTGAMSNRVVVAAPAPTDSMAARLPLEMQHHRAGLCLIVGTVSIEELADLGQATQLYVQALVPSVSAAEALRAMVQQRPTLAARVSVAWRQTPHLPCLDNLLNVVIIKDWSGADTKGLTLPEVVRVLCPGGMAILGSDRITDVTPLLAEANKVTLARAEKLPCPGGWIKITKQQNPDFGDWPSCAGGADASSVSSDRVAAPGSEVRWINAPLWANFGSTYRSEIFAGGRTFHEECNYVKPGVNQWYFVARDAFNGCELWREKMGEPDRRAPGALDPSLCADATTVYHNEGKALVGRDAASGKVTGSFEATRNVITLLEKWFVMSSGSNAVVSDRATGKILISRGAYCHPAAVGDMVYFYYPEAIEAVHLPDAKTVWKITPKELTGLGYGYGAISLKGDIVFVKISFAASRNLTNSVAAFDRATGAMLWVKPLNGSFFPGAEQAWIMDMVPGEKKDAKVAEHSALDPKTGNVLKVYRPSRGIAGRCWWPRATERYFIYDQSIFIDRASFETKGNAGFRSSCSVGHLPAYGLLYYLPHTCNCGVSLRGVLAISGGSHVPVATPLPPLYGGTSAAPAAGTPAAATDWPMFRSNAARGDVAGGELPAQLTLRWTATLGSRPLLQSTAAAGVLFATDPEAHAVVAVDAGSGKEKWRFTAEGRVSIPPTYYNGVCLFGDHAGWIYCLDAPNGKRIWQFFAAPRQQYMSAFNQLESTWPVKSGVLVQGGVAYAVAGRSSDTDGGLIAYGVDVFTGQEKSRQAITETRVPTDLLSSNGNVVWLGEKIIADNKSKAPGEKVVFRSGKSWQGVLSILDMTNSLDPIQTIERKCFPTDGRVVGSLVAFDKNRGIASQLANAKGGGGASCILAKGTAEWSNKTTGQDVQALLLAGSRVYAAGVPQARDAAEPPVLLVLNAADGKELQRLPLPAAPVIDGLSAAAGKLLISTVSGQILCFE